jgi:hypothetical protein
MPARKVAALASRTAKAVEAISRTVLRISNHPSLFSGAEDLKYGG